MLTLRCTKKLLTRLGEKPHPTPPASTTTLGDWYADVLNLGRERLVLCVSERTLLPVIVPVAGGMLDEKLAFGLRNILEALGVPKATIDAEVAQGEPVTYAKTVSRSVLGSMRDFHISLPYYRQDRPSEPYVDLALKLAETPCGPMQYQSPDNATVALLTGKSAGRRVLKAVPPPPPSPPRRPTVEDWLETIADALEFSFRTTVLGVEVKVVGIELTEEQSIVAVCQRGSSRQTVPLIDLPLPKPLPKGAEWVQAYRRWLGL